MYEVAKDGWIKHPSEVPRTFTIECIREQRSYTYVVHLKGVYKELHQAFAWTMLRRAHAVGHASRVALQSAVRHLIRFLESTKYKARYPADVDSDLLRRFATWLKSEKSKLGYRSAAAVYRSILPALQQWIGQEWAAPNLSLPRHQFPDLSRAPRIEPQKGYSQQELDKIAASVLKDIAEHDSHRYIPKFLGKPAPLGMVAVSKNGDESRGDRWKFIEYRTWWWEEHCQCQMLSSEEIRAMPRGSSMVFGGAYKAGEGGRTIDAANKALKDFYIEIGAGPNYVRKYHAEPHIHITPWTKWEYLLWYWDNHCEHRWTPHNTMKIRHKRFYVALREHFGGLDLFYKKTGIDRQRPSIDYLCPYYIGLLLTTSLNPSTIQRLQINCLVDGALDNTEASIAWSKPRAARSGLTIPASSAAKLAPRNLIEKILALTATSRGERKYLFASAEIRSARATLAPHKATFEKALRRWFRRHSISRLDDSQEMSRIDRASNFRPALAKLGYEKTGDIGFVKSLLGHARTETSVNYVGALPRDVLMSTIGLHIDAIFLDSTANISPKKVTHSDDSQEYHETVLAHCRDIKNSPFIGQRAGVICSLTNACLSCKNLVVTHEDLVRYFASKNYYSEILLRGEIDQGTFDDLMSDRIFMYETQIIPKYDKDIVDRLKERAADTPPEEYQNASGK